MGCEKQEDIAIVGIGCRFPGGAVSPKAFWSLLERGFDAITEPPATRPGFSELFDPDPKKPGRTYLRRGGFLEGVDLFDAPFFGVSPREAVHIDPQHRLLLELVQEACEDAGIPPKALAGTRTGVFIGISTHDYGDIQMYPQHRADIDMHTNSGTATSIAANRISFMYDLCEDPAWRSIRPVRRRSAPFTSPVKVFGRATAGPRLSAEYSFFSRLK